MEEDEGPQQGHSNGSEDEEDADALDVLGNLTVEERFNHIITAFDETGGSLDLLIKDPRLLVFKRAAQAALRTINLFMNVESACKLFHKIATVDFELMDQDRAAPAEIRERRRQMRADSKAEYVLLTKLIPDYDKYLNCLQNDHETLFKICRFMDRVISDTRGNDLGGIRKDSMAYLVKYVHDRGNPSKLATTKDKSIRGFHSITTGRMLCPYHRLNEFDADPKTFCLDYCEGRVIITAGDFSSFLYAKVECYDDTLPPDLGLCQGPFLVSIVRHLFTGPRTALREEDGKMTGRAPIASLIGVRSVTPRMIAYGAVLGRFLLNTQQGWSANDGQFSGLEFFKAIVALFDDDEDWASETLTWWNKRVFGDETPRDTTEFRGQAAPTLQSMIRARRAERRAAALDD